MCMANGELRSGRSYRVYGVRTLHELNRCISLTKLSSFVDSMINSIVHMILLNYFVVVAIYPNLKNYVKWWKSAFNNLHVRSWNWCFFTSNIFSFPDFSICCNLCAWIATCILEWLWHSVRTDLFRNWLWCGDYCTVRFFVALKQHPEIYCTYLFENKRIIIVLKTLIVPLFSWSKFHLNRRLGV